VYSPRRGQARWGRVLPFLSPLTVVDKASQPSILRYRDPPVADPRVIAYSATRAAILGCCWFAGSVDSLSNHPNTNYYDKHLQVRFFQKLLAKMGRGSVGHEETTRGDA